MTPPHVIGIIKSTGWTFELPIFCLWYCTTACSYFAAEALLFKINLLITITYEVGISMWLQHTFTERRNLRGRACLFTCLKLLDFTGKTIGQKYIFPPATLSSNTFLYFTQEQQKQCDIFTHEFTLVEKGQTVAKVKQLIVDIYNSVYSDLIATHWVMEETGLMSWTSNLESSRLYFEA